MEVTSGSGRIRLLLIAAAFLACAAPRSPGQLPPTAVTMRGDRPAAQPLVLGTRVERARDPRTRPARPSSTGRALALACGYLRFNVDRAGHRRCRRPRRVDPLLDRRPGLSNHGSDSGERATPPGESIASDSRPDPSAWASTVSTAPRSPTTSFLSGPSRSRDPNPAHNPPHVTLDPLSAPAWNLALAAARSQRRPRCPQAIQVDSR